MNKKKISLIIIMFLFMALMGCSSKSSDSSKTALAKAIAKNKAENSQLDEKRVDDFINTLISNGFKITAKELVSSAIIGSKEGYELTVNGSNIEVFICDLTSNDETTVKNLEGVYEKGIININGITSKAKLNKHLMLMGYGNHPDKDKIEKIFTDLK